MPAPFVASARCVANQHAATAELVTVRAVAGRHSHPSVVGGVDEITNVGHQNAEPWNKLFTARGPAEVSRNSADMRINAWAIDVKVSAAPVGLRC